MYTMWLSKAVPPPPCRQQEEKNYSSYSFLTLALDGGECSVSHTRCALPPGKGPLVSLVQEAGCSLQLVWTQRLEEKSFPLPGIELQSPGCPVCSQTVHWLSYPDSMYYVTELNLNEQQMTPNSQESRPSDGQNSHIWTLTKLLKRTKLLTAYTVNNTSKRQLFHEKITSR
jgi:hypothetical protein